MIDEKLARQKIRDRVDMVAKDPSSRYLVDVTQELCIFAMEIELLTREEGGHLYGRVRDARARYEISLGVR
jgi:hypothetical protein